MECPQPAEQLLLARQSLDTATGETIVECCQNYLKRLEDYRDELYKFRGSPGINRQQKAELPREAVDALRKEVRRAVEKTTKERNKIEDLLKSFVAISGYEALETFNRLNYKGFSDWELKAGGVRFAGGAETDKISVQDAVQTASQLRREEFVEQQTVFAA